MKSYLLALLLSATALLGCTGTNRKRIYSYNIDKFNYSMYKFNSGVLDSYLVRPIAVAWSSYVPQPMRNGISNFTSNLEEPAIAINYLLQRDPYHGMVHFTRFFLNTLLGIGGFIDVAGLSNQKLQREQSHRFGSTLGYYGVGYGPYFYLPFYGSFTLRDDGGDMLDMLYPALSWLTWSLSISKWVLEGIETRSQLLAFDRLLHQSSDPYITVRESYFQRHDFVVNKGKIKSEESQDAKTIESEIFEIDRD